MSLKAIVWVLEESDATLGDRLTLLALADNADDDGRDAYPSLTTIAEKARLSVRQVRRCLRNLEESGQLVTAGTSNYGTTVYNIVMSSDKLSPRTSTTPNGNDMSAEPSFELAVYEGPENTPLTAKEPSESRVREKLGRVDRKPVTQDEQLHAEAILRYWNTLAKQDLTSKDWLGKIIMRLREHPDLPISTHYEAIYHVLNDPDPWWTGPPSPSIVYGNGAQFERCLTATSNGYQTRKQPMRYGRGLTTSQLIERFRER